MLLETMEANGIDAMVTISTRIRRHGDLLAIAERYDDVFCSIGTHPHNAHEELDVTIDDVQVAQMGHCLRDAAELLNNGYTLYVAPVDPRRSHAVPWHGHEARSWSA